MRFQSRVSIAVVTVLNISLGVMFLSYSIFVPRALRESLQRERRDIAIELEARLRPSLTPVFDYAAVERFLMEYKTYFPADSFLLANEEGLVTTGFGYAWDAPGAKLSLDQLNRFIEPATKDHTVHLDIRDRYGRDEQYAFSAARTEIDGKPAYLVILLGIGTAPGAVQVKLEDVGIYMALLLTLVVGGTGSVCALLLLHGMFRKLNNLADGVRTFSETNSPLQLPTDGVDELAALGTALNGMSGTIAALLGELRDRDFRRRELIACTWHDIRSPLTALRGAIELFEDQPEEKAKLDLSLKQSTRMLTEIVDQLYDLSKLESAELEPRLGPVDLAETVDTVIVTAKPLAQERNVSLRTDIPDGNFTTIADPVLMYRALRNLLDNAIRHTDDGGAVTVRLAGTEKMRIVEVVDDGEGIDEALLPHLFEPFKSGARPGLLGLGLAIVSRIVKLHGGELEVANQAEGGAVFRIKLPVTQVQAEVDQSPEPLSEAV